MAIFDLTVTENLVDGNNILGETVVIGDLVYLSTNGKYFKATASLNSKSTSEVKITLEAGIADDAISMLVYGHYIFTDGTVLSPGSKYYISTTSGNITSQLYINTNNIIRYVGTAFSADTLLFNPDQTFISDNARKINDVAINISHTHVEADVIDLDKYTQAEVDNLISTATDNHFAFNQASAVTVWTIAHSLSKFPSVSVFDTSGNNVDGEIVHTDNNNLTITFNTAFAGDAYLN